VCVIVVYMQAEYKKEAIIWDAIDVPDNKSKQTTTHTHTRTHIHTHTHTHAHAHTHTHADTHTHACTFCCVFSATIDLIMGRPRGLLALLDSACKMPQGSDDIFTTNIFSLHQVISHSCCYSREFILFCF